MAKDTPKKGKYVFQVIAGEHQGNKRTYVKGDIFRSDHRLDEMFQGKFTLMPDVNIADDETDGDDTLRAGKGETKTMREEAPSTPDDRLLEFMFESASNVTHLFPAATKIGLAVFKDTLNGYGVAHADDKNPTNLAGQVLGSKKAVNEFLAEYARTMNDND